MRLAFCLRGGANLAMSATSSTSKTGLSSGTPPDAEQGAAGSPFAAALAQLPSGFFVLTAAHGEHRCAVRVPWVQQCCADPPMIMVSVEKGKRIAPIVRDARAFTISQHDVDDRHTARRLDILSRTGPEAISSAGFERSPNGAPIFERARCVFNCQLIRHVDIECDNELYVGVVTHAELRDAG